MESIICPIQRVFFWLVFEADRPDEVILLIPDFFYNFFDKTIGMAIKCFTHPILDADGKPNLLFVENPHSVYKDIEGRKLVAYQQYSMYHDDLASIVLTFSRKENEPRWQKEPIVLMDWMEESNMDKQLIAVLAPEIGFIAPENEVIHYLQTSPIHKPFSNPWYYDKHYHALCNLHHDLKNLIIKFQRSCCGGGSPLPLRVKIATDLWRGLNDLSALQIAIAHGTKWVAHSWADKEGDDYGACWESVDEIDINTTLAPAILEHLPHWRKWLLRSTWEKEFVHPLIQDEVIEDKEEATEWLKSLEDFYLSPLMISYQKWRGAFQNILRKV